MTQNDLRRLWQSLDEVLAASTDSREWCFRLGDEWPVARKYLKATGRYASELACPSPGGSGCPRKVVGESNGPLRAVCGNRPAECPPVAVSRDEITILTLDRKRLAQDICDMLGTVPDIRSDSCIIGSQILGAARVQVVLLIPGPKRDADAEISQGFDRPAAIVVPTSRSLDTSTSWLFRQRAHVVIALADIIVDCSPAGLRCAQPLLELLKPLREKLALTGAVKTIANWQLPSDARWEELTMEFTATEVVNVRFRGQTRRIEPENLRMKSFKNGRPTLSWILLQSLAQTNGRLKGHDANSASKLKKRKQMLSKDLKLAFGLTEDPFKLERNAGYAAKFVIHDSDPASTRRQQR